MEEMETTSPVPRRRHSRDNRYRMLEKYMTYALLGDAGVFVLYLISAGFGIGWLKAFFAVVGIVGPGPGVPVFYTGIAAAQKPLDECRPGCRTGMYSGLPVGELSQPQPL